MLACSRLLVVLTDFVENEFRCALVRSACAVGRGHCRLFVMAILVVPPANSIDAEVWDSQKIVGPEMMTVRA